MKYQVYFLFDIFFFLFFSMTRKCKLEVIDTTSCQREQPGLLLDLNVNPEWEAKVEKRKRKLEEGNEVKK